LTKGNSGIGFEVATQLLADASNHVLLGARSADKGAAAVKKLQSLNLPGTVELVQIDVANEDSVAAAAKTVESTYGRSVYISLT
jgi:NAD(P)-dependent dehydrogenase (short-subunit alcohol dehydrogenase family)